MGWELVGNALIGQSGGPTAVINQSLVGAVLEAMENRKNITGFLGAVHGVQGILNENFIDLFSYDKVTLQQVADSPSAALGSVRHKPSEEECKKVFEICQRNNVRYFFYIGGNDSAETAYLINQLGKAAGYEIRMVHIPKTIDNDLRVTDHCPGFGSAARFVAQAFMGDNLDNRSLKGVKINVVMGRHAGFLTAASALGRQYKDDGPHLVYVPEVAFDEAKFCEDVAEIYKNYGRCQIAISEGIHDESGKTIAEKFMQEVDAHGNVQLSGSGALGDHLSAMLTKSLTERFGKKPRVRADTFGYLQRCFPGVVSETDAEEAMAAGRAAVKFAVSGDVDGSVVIKRKDGERYEVDYELVPLQELAKHTKSLPRNFINEAGNNVTREFIDYALPLVGKLPRIARFNEMLD